MHPGKNKKGSSPFHQPVLIENVNIFFDNLLIKYFIYWMPFDKYGVGLVVFKSDWSRAGLRIDLLVFVYSPYEDRLLSSSSLTDSNALIKTR